MRFDFCIQCSFSVVVIKSVLRKGMLGGNILAQLAGFYVVGTNPITESPQNQPRNIMIGKTAVWHKHPSKTVSLIYNTPYLVAAQPTANSLHKINLNKLLFRVIITV